MAWDGNWTFSSESMRTIELVETSGGQTISLPEEFRFSTPIVSIRREGDAVILEPKRSDQWPEHFFEDIRIDDPAFGRGEQGTTPPAPLLD
jgi:virulence-associated protein VagC